MVLKLRTTELVRNFRLFEKNAQGYELHVNENKAKYLKTREDVKSEEGIMIMKEFEYL